MYELITEHDGKVIGITARAKLTQEELDELVAYLEGQIERHGKIRILFEMVDFQGWKVQALVKDLRFDFKHNKDVERVAMVGEEAWEKWLTTVMKFFAQAEVQYFNETHLAEAWSWVTGKV